MSFEIEKVVYCFLSEKRLLALTFYNRLPKNANLSLSLLYVILYQHNIGADLRRSIAFANST